jgi:hypothetical protein
MRPGPPDVPTASRDLTARALANLLPVVSTSAYCVAHRPEEDENEADGEHCDAD